MKNKLFILSLLFLFPFSFQTLTAQSSIGKAINNAIASNSKSGDYYVAKISEKKNIEVNSVKKYCKNKYAVRNIKTKEKQMFGELKTVVTSFEFRDLKAQRDEVIVSSEKNEQTKKDSYEAESKSEPLQYDINDEEFRPLLDKIMIGKWTGLIGYLSRTDYELELKKVGKKYIGKSKTGSGILLVEAYFDENQDFIVEESRDKDPNTRDLKCVKKLKLELKLRFDKMDIILRGKVASTDCRSRGETVQISKKDSKDKLKEYIEESLNHVKIKETEIVDFDGNGVVDLLEPTCVNVKLSNLTPFKYDDVVMTAYGVNKDKEFLLMRDVTTLNKYIEGFKGFTSTVWDEVNGDNLKIVYKMGHKDLSVQFGESQIPLSNKKFTNLQSRTGFKRSDFFGYWTAGSGNNVHLLNFQENGRFEYSYNGKKLKYGKWVFYSGYTCSSKEVFDKIIFYDMTNITLESVFLENFDQENYSLNPKKSSPGETFEISIDMLIGGFKWYNFLKVEETVPNNELIDELDRFITGKWQTSNGFTKFNFEENHRAVQHNPVNQSDEGYWYWSYKESDNSITCYLWVVLGRVYGREKYELILNKSDRKTATLRRISGKDEGNTMTIYKDDSIVVPEDVMGLRPDEMLYATLLGTAIEEGLNGGETTDIFDNMDIRKINDNVYTRALSLIRKLNN